MAGPVSEILPSGPEAHSACVAAVDSATIQSLAPCHPRSSILSAMPPRLALRSLLLLGASAALLAQGPLTPPGAPMPQGKALAQVEPREDLNRLAGDASATRVISVPGSYYLTGNLIGDAGKAGIRVETSHVTIDLNGFRVEGGAGGTIGVQITSGPTDVAVRNGRLLRWPTGVGAPSGTTASLNLHDLVIAGCGDGVSLASATSATATRVHVFNGAGSGIVLTGTFASVAAQCTVSTQRAASSGTVVGIVAAVVSQCAVTDVHNSGGDINGIQGQEISDCWVAFVVASGTGNAQGIAGGSVSRCRASDIYGSAAVTGIRGATVHDCSAAQVGTNVATPSDATGIAADAVANCSVRQVRGGTNAAVGISAPRVADSAVVSVTGVAPVGIGGYRLATGCTVTDLFETGGGASAGFSCPTAGETRNCQASNAGSRGIHHAGSGAVRGCTVSDLASGSGIVCDSVSNIIEDNLVTRCTNGILFPNGNSLVVRNRVTFVSGTRFSSSTNAQVGPEITTAGTITNANPWANFSF